MKKLNLKRFAILAMLLALAGLVSAMCGGGIETFSDVFNSPEGIGSIAMAVPVVKGGDTTETTAATSQNLLARDVDKVITKIDPAYYPLDQLTRKVGKVSKAQAKRVEFYEVQDRDFETAVTTLVEFAAEAEVANVIVEDVSMFLEEDTVQLDGVPAYKEDGTVLAGASLECFIYEIDIAASTLKLQPVDGFPVLGVPNFKTGDDIAVGTGVYRLSSAAEESALKATELSINPTDNYNLIQKVIGTVKQSSWDKLSLKEVDWSIADNEMMTLKDIRYRIENAAIFGRRRIITSKKDNKSRQLSGGAVQFVTRTLDLSTTTSWGNEEWTKISSFAFAGINGTKNKVALCGQDVLDILNGIEYVQENLDINGEKNAKIGLNVSSIKSLYGMLDIIPAPMFDKQGYSNKMLIVDTDYLEKSVFQKEVYNYDDAALGTSDSNSVTIIEAFTYKWKNPDAHSWITFPKA